ncbi:hypothetical protein HYW21_03320 [Candidatus Woesearchaeota archaeon]|nr:hypothetical protein [Candidatus Woesearchaeota archaeon]
MHKRAQSLSLNVIIVAALALLVLVVLALIFTGKINIWGSQVKDCVQNGGECQTGPDCEEGFRNYNAWKCADESGEPTDEVCCLELSV